MTLPLFLNFHPVIGPRTCGTGNQNDGNFSSVLILLSLFTGLKTPSMKSVICHLIDSERDLHMNMHRNLWQAVALVASQY